jgi:hypothetical protein
MRRGWAFRRHMWGIGRKRVETASIDRAKRPLWIVGKFIKSQIESREIDKQSRCVCKLRGSYVTFGYFQVLPSSGRRQGDRQSAYTFSARGYLSDR